MIEPRQIYATTIGIYDQNWETCLVTRGRWVGECFGKRAALEGTGGWVDGPGRPGRNLGGKLVSKNGPKKGVNHVGSGCKYARGVAVFQPDPTWFVPVFCSSVAAFGACRGG